MLTYANHVGLFSEEIGLSGEQLRQLPAGVHASGLDPAAVGLDAALDGKLRGLAPVASALDM